jgi:hypothetical protein
MVLTYQGFCRSAESGNNLIVEQIHEPRGGVPLRMEHSPARCVFTRGETREG